VAQILNIHISLYPPCVLSFGGCIPRSRCPLGGVLRVEDRKRINNIVRLNTALNSIEDSSHPQEVHSRKIYGTLSSRGKFLHVNSCNDKATCLTLRRSSAKIGTTAANCSRWELHLTCIYPSFIPHCTHFLYTYTKSRYMKHSSVWADFDQFKCR